MKKSIRFRARVLARASAPVLSVLSLAVASSVYANDSEISAVVVTATRFESSPQNNPIATQVITAEEILESSAITVAEVLGKLGGVHTRSSFTGIPDASLDLRGFGMTGDQNTLVLVNGQRLSENEGIAARLSSIPLNSIERIEIMRGSGSVLYGSGASSGTINIITRTAIENDLAGTASVMTGSHNLQDSRASIQSQKDQLGISLSGQKYKTDNYRYGNRADLETMSGELRYGDKKEFIALNFGADNQKSQLPGVRKVNLVTGVNQFLNDPRGITTPNDYLDSKTNFVSITGEKKQGDLTLALDLGKRNKTRRSFGSYEDNSGTSLADTRTEVVTVSPRLLWSTHLSQLKNLLTVGADWSDWSFDNSTVGTGSQDTLIEKGTQNNQAMYFRDEIIYADKTRLSLGARSERVKQDNRYVGHDGWGNPEVNETRTFERRLSSHEIALQHSLDAGYSLYGRAGRSFRIANIDEIRCSTYSGCGLFLKPQTSDNREIGLQWRGNRSNLRVSLFDMNVNNEIHYNPYTYSNVNLSPTKHRGLELDGKYLLGKTLELGARYVHTEAHFREGWDSGYDLAGKNVPLVPKERFGINLNWRMLETTRMALHLNHVGRQRYDNDQANLFRTMPSYTTVDVKLTHEIRSWTLAVGVNNLLDKAYYSYGVTNVSASPSRYNVYPEDRRNGYVSAAYRF